MTNNEVTDSIRDLLAKPFPPDEIKSYSAAGRNMTYIDARAVMNRLDEVVGPACWWDEYRVLDDAAKAVECRLTVVFNSEDVPNPDHVSAITKVDVGYPNDARDAGDDAKEPLKAAYSDALKRAAVKFGIGRHLYTDARATRPAPRQSAPRPTVDMTPHLTPDEMKAEGIIPPPGSTFPGVAMVNGDGTLNFNEFWAACRRHAIDREAVAKECGGDLNNLKTMSASAAVDVFNALRDRQKVGV